MKLYRIHPAPTEPHIVTVACDGDAEAALELAKCNAWVFPQMTDVAVARETTEIWEEGA